MAILVENVRRVPRGRGALLMWKAMGLLTPFGWGFFGIACGLAAGGFLAHVADGGFLTVAWLTAAMGAVGCGVGFGMGCGIRRLAAHNCERAARRISWDTRYGWPIWLRLVSFAATAGLLLSLWGVANT